jgi:hypothetical protein
MQKWEYKVIYGYPNEQALNKLGEEGWELVAVVAGGLEHVDEYAGHPTQRAEDVYAYLKRPKS